MALDQVVDGLPLPALVYNNLSAAVDGHETRVLELEGLGRVDGDTFSTDLVSSGSTEVVGYSQPVALVSGGLYRVWFKGLLPPWSPIGGVGCRRAFTSQRLPNLRGAAMEPDRVGRVSGAGCSSSPVAATRRNGTRPGGSGVGGALMSTASP